MVCRDNHLVALIPQSVRLNHCGERGLFLHAKMCCVENTFCIQKLFINCGSGQRLSLYKYVIKELLQTLQQAPSLFSLLSLAEFFNIPSSSPYHCSPMQPRYGVTVSLFHSFKHTGQVTQRRNVCFQTVDLRFIRKKVNDRD